MRIGLCTLVALILVGCGLAGPFPKEESNIAIQTIRDLAKKDFRRVAVQFDAELAETLDAAGLEERWSDLTAELGEFVEMPGFEMDDMVLPAKGRVWTFVMRCVFEKGDAFIVIEINEAKKISYLFFPGDAARSAATPQP